jgi:GAF domain-containing protein
MNRGLRAVERTAREAVPALADFCFVHVVGGGGITCVAGTHATREGRRTMRALMRLHRIRPDDRVSAVAQVVRTRRPLVRVGIRPDVDTKVRANSVGELHRRLDPRSALVVPIVYDDAVLGTLSLCYSESGRSYAARHLSRAKRLAARIAAALMPDRLTNAARRLRPATRDARQGTASGRRLASRD